ncbi:MAG: phosphoribosyltransferase family protein [Rickettsiales bacterium]
MVSGKTFFLFGPRVSEATKQALREQLGYEEIPADFGPFGSGAPFCELFPFYKEEREAFKKQHTGLSEKALEAQFAARYEANRARLAGAHIIFVESTGEQPDVAESVERVRFAVNSFKHYGAAEITLAMPNVAYERQDRGFNEHGRLCSIGTKWLAKDLKRYEVDRVVTFAPHSQDGIKFWRDEFGERNYHPLQTTEMFAEHIRRQFPDTANVVIGAPDGGEPEKENDQGQARARELAAAVHGISPEEAKRGLFLIKKKHTSASGTECEFISGDVAGKNCVIIDDMSDGGSTLINAAKALKDRGAKSVSVYFTHAICSEQGVSKEKYDSLLGFAQSAENELLSLAKGAHRTLLSFAQAVDSSLHQFFGAESILQSQKPLMLSDELKSFERRSSLAKLAACENIDHIVTTDTVPEIIAKRAALEPVLRDKVEVLSIGPQLAQTLQQILGHEKPGTDINGDMDIITNSPQTRR